MGTWIKDWSVHRLDTSETYHDELKRKERMRRELEEAFRRRHERPDLRIVPTEQEKKHPHTPMPEQIQSIIDDLDEEDTVPQSPNPRTPYLH